MPASSRQERCLHLLGTCRLHFAHFHTKVDCPSRQSCPFVSGRHRKVSGTPEDHRKVCFYREMTSRIQRKWRKVVAVEQLQPIFCGQPTFVQSSVRRWDCVPAFLTRVACFASTGRARQNGSHGSSAVGSAKGPQSNGPQRGSLCRSFVVENDTLTFSIQARESRTEFHIRRSSDIILLGFCGRLLSRILIAICPVALVTGLFFGRSCGSKHTTLSTPLDTADHVEDLCISQCIHWEPGDRVPSPRRKSSVS